MALVLGNAPKTVKETVFIHEPTGEVNTTRQHKLTVEIRKLSRTEFQALAETGYDIEIARELVVDIDGLLVSPGEPLVYEPEHMELIFEQDYVFVPIFEAVLGVQHPAYKKVPQRKN